MANLVAYSLLSASLARSHITVFFFILRIEESHILIAVGEFFVHFLHVFTCICLYMYIFFVLQSQKAEPLSLRLFLLLSVFLLRNLIYCSPLRTTCNLSHISKYSLRCGGVLLV